MYSTHIFDIHLFAIAHCTNPYLQSTFDAIRRGEDMGSGADIIEKGRAKNMSSRGI